MLTQGLAVGGRIELPPDPRVAAYLWRYDGELLHLDMTPVHERRSVPQNRRLWAGYARALKSFSALSGHDRDELHDAMKNRFLQPARLYTADGRLIGEARSTRRLSVPAFGDYMEQVSALFAGWGCDLYPEAR
ncbi:MAG: hypothetical protein ACM33U_08645 [Solirubrobacterales bacterium]